MDRSHTMISMRGGTLKLAVPTTDYAKMVHKAEQDVALDESMCGPMTYSQHHAKVESLIENAVWHYICKYSEENNRT
jgi:hypothetical protein